MYSILVFKSRLSTKDIKLCWVCRDGSDEKIYELEHADKTDEINCTRIRTTPEGYSTVAECLLPKRYVGDKIKNCVLGK